MGSIRPLEIDDLLVSSRLWTGLCAGFPILLGFHGRLQHLYSFRYGYYQENVQVPVYLCTALGFILLCVHPKVIIGKERYD